MAFLWGVLGAAAVAALLGLGFALGWHGRGAIPSSRRPEAPGEAEERRLAEEQEAFRLMQNYSTERAYGMAGTKRTGEHR